MIACLACTDAVAAWHVSATVTQAWPEASVLCLTHLRALLAARRAAAVRAARDAARIWCACGREMYLAGRERCEACRLGLGPPDPIPVRYEPLPIPARAAPERPPRSDACQRCGKPGRPYPGGQYCGDPCAPAQEAWMVHPRRCGAAR